MDNNPVLKHLGVTALLLSGKSEVALSLLASLPIKIGSESSNMPFNR